MPIRKCFVRSMREPSKLISLFRTSSSTINNKNRHSIKILILSVATQALRFCSFFSIYFCNFRYKNVKNLNHSLAFFTYCSLVSVLATCPLHRCNHCARLLLLTFCNQSIASCIVLSTWTLTTSNNRADI